MFLCDDIFINYILSRNLLSSRSLLPKSKPFGCEAAKSLQVYGICECIFSSSSDYSVQKGIVHTTLVSRRL